MKYFEMLISTIGLIIFFTGCSFTPEPGTVEHIRNVTSAIDENRLINADSEPENWLSYGRNYAEDRFNPLDQINTENVDKLSLAWSHKFDTKRGSEATPLVVDGILYTTGPWSIVYAFDVRKGELLWSYDPAVPEKYEDLGCCDVVNRGPALYKGKVYVGVYDGRLIALDAATGTLQWEIITVDQSKAYTITGAPRIVDGNVIIGNAGAEFGVRGYVSAYDAETGEMVWRTYTVPGNPSQPFESEAMEKAAETWSGEWWNYGGGGTVWDAIVYDPELELLYIGVGNGSPWNRHIRSPGGGDNLYLASIMALDPSDGELVWHYQTVPGDTWDFTATQPMILADLEINEEERKVLMQAPKNGFFYVLDRETGEFISAENYVEVNWAEGIAPESGRPIEKPDSDYKDKPADITPSVYGGHNWHPMAYNPITGLVYIPTHTLKQSFENDTSWVFTPNEPAFGVKWEVHEEQSGSLLAWDPINQKEVWKVPYPNPINGGVLATGGNLIFQGDGGGGFKSYNVQNGELLWEFPTGSGIIAPPITYMVDGIQFVTITTGLGGAWSRRRNTEGNVRKYKNTSHLLTFSLNGEAPSPDFEKKEAEDM